MSFSLIPVPEFVAMCIQCRALVPESYSGDHDVWHREQRDLDQRNCQECGATVDNYELHMAWHMWLSQQAGV